MLCCEAENGSLEPLIPKYCDAANVGIREMKGIYSTNMSQTFTLAMRSIAVL
jgi:hypothetical protein